MGAPRRVLQVDPDEAVRSRTAAAVRERTSFEYTGVSTVEQGLLRADSEKLDCVVTAARLDDTDGVDLLASIREAHEGVAVVFCDAAADPTVPARALNHGADGYVHRDGEDWPEQLIERIHAAIRTRREHEDYRQASSILDSLFEQIPEHIHLYVKDEHGTHIRVTDTLFDADMLLGKPDYEVVGVPPSESETYQDDLHVIESGERLVEREGRSPLYEKWLSTWKVPWHDGVDVVGLIGFTEDITERKRYEQRLETLTERFELAVDVTGVGVVDWDLNSRSVNFHGAARAILGLEQREMLSPSTLRDRVHPDDVAAIDRLLDADGDDSDVEIEFRVTSETGWRWVELAGECRTDETGVPERVIGIVTGTTERKERQRARQLQRRRITALHDIAADLQHCGTATAVCERTIDAADDVLQFDQCAIMLRSGERLPIEASSDGLDAAEIESLGVTEGLAGQCFQEGTASVVPDVREDPVARPKGPFRSVLSVPVGERGVFQAVSAEADQFDDDDLELTELLVTHTATALARLDREAALEQQTERLQSQNERLDRFASIVSHDLRNPLEVARGHLELVESDDEHLDRVATMHERMDDLLGDLLTLAREGDRVADLEPIDLASVADRCWHSVETDGAALDVTGTLSFAADSSGLRQLLENLYRNAVEHGSTSPRSHAPEDAVEHGSESVTIRVGPLEDGFFVEDDGPGIAPEIRDRIFDPGFSTDDDGTGYGLSIVSEIADAHGWRVSATESDSGGARFEIGSVTVEQDTLE
jgi:PAS domain S-box-containing protein